MADKDPTGSADGGRIPLTLFNTLSGKMEGFGAVKPPAVKMYTCGPTVYDYVHIGNLRAFVFADIAKRTLRYNGYQVEHTMNFTDFGHLVSDADDGEDKMMKALRRANKEITIAAMREVSDIYIEAFKEDVAALNIESPTHWARASDYIKEQVALIKTLVEKGYTYETTDGVYFDVSRFPEYGKLGNIDLTKLKEGARVEINPEKKHPADFALWKKGDLGWDSAWGKGFPGWHIECTAMAFATLGRQFDIHTGGVDLAATHHNGEIAQAEAATKKSPYVRYWMHNAFVSIDNTKISKSLGNSITLRQLRDRGYSGADYRYWLMGGHYRSPMNFTFEALDGAKQALFRLKRHLYEEFGSEAGNIDNAYRDAFHRAVNNDLDTPAAIATLWELVRDTKVNAKDKVATIRDFDRVLAVGLSEKNADAAKTLGIIRVEDLPKDVQALIEEREAARREKRWDDADELRTAINLKGYLVEDTASGARVTKAS